MTALVALGIVEAVEDVHGVDVLDLELNSVEYLHILIEALRLAFADSKFIRPRLNWRPSAVETVFVS